MACAIRGSQNQREQAKHQTTAEDNGVAVISCEARREYIDDWEIVLNNPVRYIHDHIHHMQGVISSWSKRWYKDNKQVTSSEAVTWHGFFKLPREDLPRVLPQSGKSGIFIVPKDGPSTSASGQYRVVWTQSADLAHAQTVMRAYPSAQGLVRGKASLGIRVAAHEYSSIRRRLEPSWDPNGIKTDIPIVARWSMAPIPESMDKKAIQKVLDAMTWDATPLRQVNHNTWLLGSSSPTPPASDTVELNGKLVLITPAEQSKGPQLPETLVAGPTALRKAINKQVAHGTALVNSYASNPQDPAVPQGPTMTQVGALQADLDKKLQDMTQQFRHAIEDLQQKHTDMTSMVGGIQQNQQQINQAQADCSQRIQSVEQSVQSLSSAVVTKTDLTEALTKAMEVQRSELRLY